jgi:beta-lactamase regulating signal transducer with metallopeptidase domain
VRNAESLILTYAVNMIWITCAVAGATAILDRALHRVSASQRHALWVAALMFSALLPLSTLRQEAATVPSAAATSVTSPSSLPTFFHAARQATSLPVTDTLMHVLLAAYLALVATRLIGLARAWNALARMASNGTLFRYADVAGPFTFGVRRPVVLFPQWLERKDRRAAMRHEVAHIRRHDFLLNAIYEFLLVPLAFHPAGAFIKSRIDQTREIACDDIASSGARTAYAESLLNMAIAGLTAASGSAPRFAVALFDSDSLEKRIRNLVELRPRMSCVAAQSLVGTTIALLCAASIGAATMSVRVATAADVQRFAGHWVGEFQGHRFFSMELVQKGDKLTGKISRFSIRVDGSGELTSAEEREGFTPIVETRVAGNVLHIAGEDRATTTEGRRDRIDLDLAVIARDRGEIRIPDSPVKPWSVRRQ